MVLCVGDTARALLEMTVCLRIPRGRDSDTLVIETTIPGREELSFSDWVIRQPVKCGGMGLRAYVETCAPAFIGAVEMAIPSLYTGYCPQLTEWVGGEDRFGQGVLSAGRWRTLITSGCRAGQEYKAAWNLLRQETDRAMAFLGEEEEEIRGPIASSVEDSGDGSTSGVTRGMLVET